MKISQREARRLRKRVSELEQADAARHRLYTSEYPGINIFRATMNEAQVAMIETAQKLNHSVIAKNYNGFVYFYATRKVGD